jgi:hypothetical protein
MRTFDLDEAAAFLHMSPAVLRQKAAQKLVKGAKPGKCWVFLEDDLVAYLGSLYSESRQAPLSGSSLEVSAWESTNAVMSGGSTSPIRTDAEYASLLGLKTGKRRRSCTTD